ncbi:MAG: benzoate/H(+) symporter BenE family transporter [Bacillota bacterium]|nr:benzoate/H(+) symporter BenE family transporter [Bacillota bacterium]
MLEKPSLRFPIINGFLKDSNRFVISNAFIAFLFTQTGPIAILLSAAHLGGLSEKEMITWLFAGYGLGGIITVILSLFYRQPISAAWSLPAAAIVGASLQHLTFPQVIGAYVITGVVITIISLTGIAKKGMAFLPMPIIMGMVAGVFLPFGLKLVSSFVIDPWLSAITIGFFFLFLSGRVSIKYIPPILISAIAGLVIIALRGDFYAVPLDLSIIRPVLYRPDFNINAIIELVLPLTISVIGIHNTQGIAILKSEGYDPPVNVMTLSCGVGSIAMGFLGSVPTCITGPVSAILNSSGSRKSRYVGGVYLGFLLFLSGIFAPVTISLSLMIPTIMIAVLGGLAMFRVILDSFHNAFKGNFTIGAFVAFMVTVSNVTFWNIGSAFWGLMIGLLISLLLEPQDFKKTNGITEKI